MNLNIISKIKHIISSQDERINWNEYFCGIAILVSCRSPSKRLKVGAVITKDNRIISCGYNGFPPGAPHISIMRDSHEINTIHAEQNAISDAAKRGVSIENSTIYITHFPCINCIKYIISAGIKNVIYIDDYRNDEVVIELCQISNINITKFKN